MISAPFPCIGNLFYYCLLPFVYQSENFSVVARVEYMLCRFVNCFDPHLVPLLFPKVLVVLDIK